MPHFVAYNGVHYVQQGLFADKEQTPLQWISQTSWSRRITAANKNKPGSLLQYAPLSSSPHKIPPSHHVISDSQ